MNKPLTVKEKSIAQLLGDIRTKGTKSEDSALELARRLTHKEDWTHSQCLSLYESILRHYYHGDPDKLELLLAVSGLLEEYRSFRTATERRNKYLRYLDEREPKSKYAEKDPETIRKEEEASLTYVADQLVTDWSKGKLPRNLVDPFFESSPTVDSRTDEKNQDKLGETIGGEADPETLENNNNEKQPTTIITIENDTSKEHSISKLIKEKPYLLFIGVFTIVMVVVAGVYLYRDIFKEVPPVTEIHLSKEEVILSPGEIYDICALVRPPEASEAHLNYASLDTETLTVSHDGKVMAQDNAHGDASRTAQIMVQAENGVTETKDITVDFSKGNYSPSVQNIDDYEPDFIITQKARFAGTSDWQYDVTDAKIGDIVEYQIQYKNISTDGQMHSDVMIKTVLPDNVEYISDSTKLYNTAFPNGVTVNQDDIISKGINIGNYHPGANAYVCFSVKVVDIDLAYGSNTLVNWAQGGVDGVTLQDYATITLEKSE